MRAFTDMCVSVAWAFYGLFLVCLWCVCAGGAFGVFAYVCYRAVLFLRGVLG